MNNRRLYLEIISQALSANDKPRHRCDVREGYEIHHITPRSWGGSDNKENLVYLTPKQHFVAHHLLSRFGGETMQRAFYLMCHTREGIRISSAVYENARKSIQIANLSRPSPFSGHSHSEETKQLYRENRLGAKATPETKQKMSKAKLGVKREEFSDTHKESLSKAAKNRPPITCPHCGKVGYSGIMYHWHFDNCKAR